MPGVAHISFPGGGLVLPVRSPYDRQMLVEHVVDRVRSKGQIQVILDNRRWAVRLRDSTSAVSCSRCGYSVDAACYTAGNTNKAAHCVRCAFGDSSDALRPHHARPR